VAIVLKRRINEINKQLEQFQHLIESQIHKWHYQERKNAPIKDKKEARRKQINH